MGNCYHIQKSPRHNTIDAEIKSKKIPQSLNKDNFQLNEINDEENKPEVIEKVQKGKRAPNNVFAQMANQYDEYEQNDNYQQEYHYEVVKKQGDPVNNKKNQPQQKQRKDESDEEDQTESSNNQAFIQEALKAHNDYRRKHGSSPLKINNSINKIAQAYAEKIAKTNNFAHSSNEYKGDSLGENLYMCQGTLLSGKTMTKVWYDEIEDYDFKKADCISGTGHFTQVIWADSKEVGFGLSKARDGSYYGVANYYPAGNFIGEFEDNVKPIGGIAGKKSCNNESKKSNAYYQNIHQNNDDDDDDDDDYKPKQKAYKGKEDSDDESDDNGGNSNQTMDKFIKDSLEHHNQLRKKHHAPPLKINKELNKIALKYAETMAKSNNFAHSSNEYKGDSLGENLYMCQGSCVTGKKMTQSWYDEIKDYNFKKGNFSSETGHFTQVVWIGSTEVGFGYAQAKDGSYYAVANYYPPGNFMGKFPNNVMQA